MSARELLHQTLSESLFDRGPNVREWPEDERDLHRNPDWSSFTERAAAVEALRFQKAADAVLAALDAAGYALVELSKPDDTGNYRRPAADGKKRRTRVTIDSEFYGKPQAVIDDGSGRTYMGPNDARDIGAALFSAAKEIDQ
jgi:hypothetical protein